MPIDTGNVIVGNEKGKKLKAYRSPQFAETYGSESIVRVRGEQNFADSIHW